MRRALIDQSAPAFPSVTRRRMLAVAGLAVTGLCIGPTRGKPGDGDGPGDAFHVIRARVTGAADEWAYEGGIARPLLRVRRGEEVKVRLINELPEATAVHWHGVHVPNAMDGVPGLTQAPITPGASFDYRFTPPDAGTFWYHPPLDFGAQLQRGLAGVLVVDGAAPVDVDVDAALLLSDRYLSQRQSVDVAVHTNDRLRLRLVNATVARALVIRIERHQAVVMAIDGQPAEPYLARGGRVALGPGNRVDLFIDATLAPGEHAPILVETVGGEAAVARLVYDAAPPARAAPRPDPKPLPDNPLPRLIDLTRALKLDIPLQKSGARSDRPLFSVRRGRGVVLGLVNRGDAAMAVHLHGHHFRLLDRLDDGWKPFWLDTMLVPAGESDHIAFVADNPGKWRLDLQPMGQAGAGSSGWFEVT